MGDELVVRLTKQLVANFRGRDPADPKTRADLEGTMGRVRQAADRLEEMPPPFPDAPATGTISDQEADAVIAAVLAQLAEAQ
jgi:hypothetical protein